MKKEIEDALRQLAGGDENLFEQMKSKVDGTNRSATKMINRNKPSTATTPVVKAATLAVKTATPKKVERAEDGDESEVEVTDEVIDAVMQSPKFTERFNSLLDEALKTRAESETPDEDEESESGDDEAENEDEAEEKQDVILAELRSIKKDIAELQKNRDASVQEVLNDLPSRISNKTIIRPRATRLPDDVRTRSAGSLADIAAQTLTEMGEE